MQDNFVIVGSYHKCGSDWMRNILTNVALEYDITNLSFGSLVQIYHQMEDQTKVLSQLNKRLPMMFFCGSIWDLYNVLPTDMSNVTGFRIIRHPKDVIISAMHFHKSTYSGNEFEVFIPDPKLNGLTYREHLNSLETDEDRLLFEMENRSYDTLQNMGEFDDQNIYNLKTVKYEDLNTINGPMIFHDLFESIGFDKELEFIKQTFIQDSLVFNRKKITQSSASRYRHVRDGSSNQYKNVFTDKLNARFDELFPGLLEKLGYE